jgi:hypothetical protein
MEAVVLHPARSATPREQRERDVLGERSSPKTSLSLPYFEEIFCKDMTNG